MARLRPSAIAKLGVLALGILALLPVQLVAIRLGPRRANRVPLLFHRMLCAVLGVRRTVRGRPPAAGEQGLIIANHISWLDIPVVGARAPVAFIAKSEIEGWPVIGLLARLQRTIFIDRSRRGATADVSDTMSARLNAGESLVLFAEGTTGDGTRILPLRSALIGAVQQAMAQDPADTAPNGQRGKPGDIIVWPLAISYTGRRGLPAGRAGRAMLAWYGDTELAPHLAEILNGGPVDVTLTWGEPIRLAPAGPDTPASPGNQRSASRKEAALIAENGLRRAHLAAITGRDIAP
jgi:1-acyl-sn-glycerol-3-phosphate acyltransferase